MAAWFNYLSMMQAEVEGVNARWWLHHRSSAKSTRNNPYLLANEWIAANLAWQLRLPVPPFALMRKSSASTRYFASLDYGSEETSPTDMNADAVCNSLLKLATGINVFDIFIANPDRHEGNLKVDNAENPRRVQMIDHERALFGHHSGKGNERLASCDQRLGFHRLRSSYEVHKLATEVRSDKYFCEWATRVDSIPESFIDEICNESAELQITAMEVDGIRQFLLQRKSQILSIVRKNKHFFQNVDTWGVWSQ